MGTRTERWRPGTPCWTELTVDDVESAKTFYGPLLGWSFERSPAEPALVVATVDGSAAAGISEIHEDLLHSPSADFGRPTGWLTYFATDDITASAEAVQAADGQILHAPQAAGRRGQRAVACDPTGAPFGLWQAGDAIGATHVREVGAFVWDDLRTANPDGAREFYTAVFGFRHDPPPEDAGDGHQTFAFGDESWPLGGIGPMPDDADAPPHWLVYFQVRSITGALEFVESTGGRIEARHFDHPYGRMAAIRDPQGSRFWLMQAIIQ